METLIELISNVGFPIAVCVYMMTHNTKIVKENTDTINALKNVIEKLSEKIG